MTDIPKNIVIISKEEQILTFLEKMFSGSFTINKALDIRTGIDISNREKPAAVVLDVDGTGIDVMNQVPQLKNAGAGTMVWALCSAANLETANNSILAGAVGYVSKPYTAKDWEKVIYSIKTGSIPDMPIHTQAKGAQPGGTLDEMRSDVQGKYWSDSKTVRVLSGIAAGIGYVSIPFYLIMFPHVYSCAGSTTEYCARNGSLACSIFYGNFGYMMFAGPVVLPIGIVAIVVNVITFFKKKKLKVIDILAMILGAGWVGLIALEVGANPSCGIM